MQFELFYDIMSSSNEGEKKMRDIQKSLYKDYEELLIKNDKLSEENRRLKYTDELLQKQLCTLEKREQEANEKLLELKEEYEKLKNEK